MKNRSIILTLFALGCFALCPMAQAVSPAPDGGYPNFTTAEGQNALSSLTTGSANTAVGWFSLSSNAEGSFNTAIGAGTLLFNTGNRNTATGAAALLSDTTGVDNTANGGSALVNDMTGGANTAIGAGALGNNISGNFNTAIGKDAGALATGSGNVYIGHSVAGVAGENNHTYIRNIDTTNVSGAGTDFVTIDLSTGLLGHATSSRRYKEEIRPMDKASETLYRLKPVTFRYKKEIDRTQSPVFGLIAEEVAEVNPDLVARNHQGQPESVHYEMVNAMLLNEFLKEHRTVQGLRNEIAALTSTVKEQAAQIQKVSAQVEASKAAPQVVLNNQ
jgi:hypothetical protein